MNISLQNSDSSSTLNELTQQIESLVDLPDWLKKIKLDSAQSFCEQSFPTRKTEHWKYNDLSDINSHQYKVSSKNSNIEKLFSSIKLPINSAIKCVFINGYFCRELSSTENNSSVRFTAFADANKEQANKIEASLKAAKQNKNLFIQLNSTIANDGLLLEIENDKMVEQPIYFVYLSSSTLSNEISANQVVIQCGKSSQSQIVEHFIGLTDEGAKQATFSNQETIIELGENSKNDHYRITTDNKVSKSVSRLLARLSKDASFRSFYYSEGSLLDKTDIDVWHQGQNSESNITGIYLPSENNVVDFHTCIEHQVPHCNSRENFRGIIADSAKATFNGKIHIFRDAQKSDAQLNNKNLLLTNRAEINTKPELEIYADDVVCAHGATIEKIDEKAIYYLKTRGINEMQAKKMLSIGFINELLEEVKNEELNQYLASLVQNCLSNLK